MTARRVGLGVVALSTLLLLSGCANSAGKAIAAAEGSIATRHAQLVERLTQVVESSPSGTVSPEALTDAYVVKYVLLTETEQQEALASLGSNTTIFALTTTESTTSVDVYLYGVGSVNAGLTNLNKRAISCGRIVLESATGEATTSDLECPDWLVTWSSSDAKEVSMTEMIAKYPAEG